MINRIQNFIIKHKNTYKDLNNYLLASMIPMLVSMAANPVFAIYLPPEQYAIVGYYASFTTLFTPFISFYMSHYYMRLYYELEEKDRKHLYQTIAQLLIWGSLLLTIIGITCIVVYSKFFNTKTDMPLWPYCILALLAPFFGGLFQLRLVQYKMQRLSLRFFFWSGGNGVLITVLSLLLVVAGAGATGKMLGAALVPAFFFILICWQERNYFLSKIDLKLASDCLIFCIPLVIAAMLGFFSGGYDKVYLERYVPVKILGIYSVGVSIATMVNVFSDAVTTTFTPDIYQSIAERNFIRFIRFVLLKLAIVSAVVIPFLILAPIAIKILTAGRYMDSVGYARIAVLSTLTSSLYYSGSQLTIALKHNYVTLLTRVIGSILCIGMYHEFIQRWHATGAAWSLVASFLIFFICNITLLGGCILIKGKRHV